MKKNVVLVVSSALALAACGSGVKESLGLQRSAPDEFAVIERAPLTMPPNFNLQPPQPGVDRPQETPTAVTAKGLVLSSQSSAPKASDVSRSEQALLGKAGAAKADPNIRSQLNDPNEGQKKSKWGLVSSEDATDKALDPVKEAEALKTKNVKTPPVPAAANAKK